jgi:hypothetical protein
MLNIKQKAFSETGRLFCWEAEAPALKGEVEDAGKLISKKVIERLIGKQVQHSILMIKRKELTK